MVASHPRFSPTLSFYLLPISPDTHLELVQYWLHKNKYKPTGIHHVFFETDLSFIGDANSAIQLIRKINYEAANSDLKLIRDDLQRLNKYGIFVCFQHIPSHKGLIHNVTADRLANEAANIDPQPESKLGNLRDIMSVSEISSMQN